MREFIKNMSLKKALALVLVCATLFLVSCGSDKTSTSEAEDTKSGEMSSQIVSDDGSDDTQNSNDASDENESEESSLADESSKTSDVSADTSEELSSENASSEQSADDSNDFSNDDSNVNVSSELPSDEPSEDKSSEASKEDHSQSVSGVGDKESATAKLESIPEYKDKNYIAINGNTPYFSSSELSSYGREVYGDLDSLGRCTIAFACLGKETMPTGPRGSISSVKPTGWKQAQYSCIGTKDLYNRSHLIAWSLAGEDANKQNLVTGTAHLNQTVMTEFEDMILDYIKETGNHVAYRVTPLFKGKELVCRGIQMEAYSVEDKGDGICFNVYCYNVQPGVIINYATGESSAVNADDDLDKDDDVNNNVTADYILNTSSKKIHLPDCSSVSKMSEKNKKAYNGTIQSLLDQGYTRCGSCLS